MRTRRNCRVTRAVRLAANRFDNQDGIAVGAALDGNARHRAGVVGVGARVRDQADIAARQFGKDRRQVGRDRFEQRGGELARQQVRKHGRIHQPAYQRIVGIRR
jgi:hypothetical protein